jgi:hypothetical protein
MAAWSTGFANRHHLAARDTRPADQAGACCDDENAFLYLLQRAGPADVFRPCAERARNEPDWRYFEIDASHSPHITAHSELAEIIDEIAHDRPQGSVAN